MCLRLNKFIYFLLLFIMIIQSKLAFAQDFDYLSFDKNKIPISSIFSYSLRSDVFYFNRFYKQLSKTSESVLSFYSSYSFSDLSFLSSKIERDLVSVDMYLNFKGMGSYWGLSFIPNYENIYGEIYFSGRSVDYFSVEDYSAGIFSGLLGIMFSYQSNYGIPSIGVYRYNSGHEYSENVYNMDKKYINEYWDTVRETSLYTYLYDITNINYYGYMLSYFYPRYNIGCLFAPGYSHIDINYLELINGNLINTSPYSQFRLTISQITRSILNIYNIKIKVPYVKTRFSLLSNYSKALFKSLINRNLEFNFSLPWIIEENNIDYEMLSLEIYTRYDLNLNEVASARIFLSIFQKVLSIGYEYSSPTSFQPGDWAIHNQRYFLEFGAYFDSKFRILKI